MLVLAMEFSKGVDATTSLPESGTGTVLRCIQSFTERDSRCLSVGRSTEREINESPNNQ
jgi:hypothetical protein